MAGKQVTGDGMASSLAGMSKTQLYDIMSQMKSLIEQNQGQARQILIQNPLFTRALFQAQIMLGMVQPSQQVQNFQPQPLLKSSPVQPANTHAVHSTPSPVDLQDKTDVLQAVPVRKQHNQPPMPMSPAQSIPSHSAPSHSAGQSRANLSTQATQVPHPQTPQVPNMPSLPLQSQPPSVHQTLMPPVPGHFQQAVHSSGAPQHQLQPPLPPQPRPPIQMQYQPQGGSSVNFQHAGIPQMHHSQPMFQSSSRPPGGIGSFPQGQLPLHNQSPHQPMYQGGGSHLGSDYSHQSGSAIQMERGSPWPPASRENASGAQLPAPLPVGPGPMHVGTQPRPPPLAPEVEQALLQQVMSLTPEQINLLPSEQRHQVLQLQQMLRQ